jgi:glycosyltransferase involved in cell wall biosynthesis
VTPSVSVLIPTYNRSWGLARAAKSVLAQTFTDFELVVTDDASPDDTEAVARSFDDPRVVYRRNPANLGVPGNWGAALQLARGKYVCFLMDDDHYDPTFLASRVAVLESEPDLTAVFSAYRRQPEGGGAAELFRPPTLARGPLARPEYFEAAVRGYAFVGTTMYRAALVRAAWPDAQRYRYVVDHALNLRLALRPGAAAFYLDEPDFTLSCHPDQISVDRGEEVYFQTRDLLQDLIAQTAAPKERRRLRLELSWLHVVWGRKARERGAYGVARRRIGEAIRAEPTNWGAWKQYARAVARW